MRNKGLKLALLGLTLGLILGACIKSLKTWGSRELIGILEEEVTASCDCKLVYDSVDISLLTLTATAVNVRLISEEQPRLTFKKVHALFSLARIFEKRVLLTELQLIDGLATGVGPDSPTFKFIDHLTAPLPPERDRPGRWRLLLQNLRLMNADFTEDFPRSRVQLAGFGGNFLMRRNADDDFEMDPTLDRLLVRPLDSTRGFPPIYLGKLAGKVVLKELTAEFEKVKLMMRDAWAEIEAISHNKKDNLLEGRMSYRIDAKSLGIAPDFGGVIRGSAVLAGSLGNPRFQSTLESGPDEQERISYTNSDIPLLSLESARGAYDFDMNHGRAQALFSSMEGEGPWSSLRMATPLKLDDGDLSGSFDVSVDSARIGRVVAEDIKLEISLAGPVDSIRLAAKGEMARLLVGDVPITPLSFEAKEEGEKIRLEVAHSSPAQGNISGSGYLHRLPNQDWEIESFDVSLQDFTYMPALPEEAQPGWIHFSGKANVQGPLDIGTVQLQGSLDTVVGQKIKVSGPAALKEGVFTYRADNEAKDIHASLNMDLLDRARSSFKLVTEDLKLTDYNPSFECAQLKLEADYSFDTSAILEGDGMLSLQSFNLGCPPYTLSLLQPPYKLPLQNGRIDVSGAAWEGLESRIDASGTISFLDGYDLKLDGSLELHSLLSVVPSLDDMKGRLEASLTIGGPLDTPLFDGKASLDNAEITIEAADLDAESINGEIKLTDSVLHVDALAGRLNGGEFQISGNLNPQAFEESRFTLVFKDVLMEPSEDANLTMDGELTLERLVSEMPAIRGQVRIASAELRKNIGLLSILRTVSDYIFATERIVATRSSLPRINLDVAIQAPRNVMVSMNWLGAELNADLNLSGTLAAPTVRGKLDTLSGWFGIKDRRFDITSGTIAFQPGSLEPELAVIGEAYIRTSSGDSNLVIVEVNGPLSAPKLRLTSDSGLSDKEILNLITIGTTTGASPGPSSTDSAGMQELPLIQEGSILTYNEFLKNLTRIDSLAVGPTFNSQTGAIEPSVIARKKLTRRLSVVAESSFGGSVTENSLNAVYELTGALKLSGGADTKSNRQATALEVDLIYTVLAPQERFLNIQIEGNDSIEKEKILSAVRLSDSSRLPSGEIERVTLAIEKFYASEGYLDSTVTGSCSERGGFCRLLTIQVREGKPRRVERILFEGDDIAAVLGKDALPEADSDTLATQSLLTSNESALIQQLRSEGYIGARVRGRYEADSEGETAVLIYSVYLGKPVSFTFRGSRIFSAEEFLETINLFKRKQPFGRNTINILVENIERLYREKGYLFVNIRHSAEEEASGRINYTIEIEEDQKVPVGSARVTGNGSIPTEALERALRESIGDERAKAVFAPPFAVAEELERNAELLREIYLSEGFPSVQVEHRLDTGESGDKANVEYIVEEGEPFRASEVRVAGLPDGVEPPRLPERPYSIPKLNRYADAILDELRGKGYIQPEIWTQLEGDRLTFNAEPGPLTRIDSIVLEGNVVTSDSLIRRTLVFEEGGAWEQAAIDQTRRKLLRLGLFSRVEIKPLDGTLDGPTETLLVKISERPLRTLDIGTGANSEYGIHLFAEGTDKKIFGDGKSLSLKLDGFYDPQEAGVSQGLAALRYTDPYFLNTRFSHSEDLRFQRISTTTQEFDVDRVSLASFLYRSLNKGRTLSFGHTISQENLDNVSADAVLSDLDKGILNLSVLSGRFDLDRRDDPLNPSAGFNLNLDYKLAAEALASEANFHEALARFSFWYPLPFGEGRFSLANSSRLGGGWTFGDTPDIPITQRFYLGGRNTIRGFRENGLGPLGEDGSVIGGDTLVSNNFELRYRIGNSLEIHTFLDAGNVFLRGRDYEQDDIRFSTGLGLRYLSPIGPIGFDIGGPLDEKEGEPSLRVHFHVGAPF